MGEITVILLLALIFIGPKKLPELASGLGRMIRQIRKTTADVKNEIVLDDTFRKPFEELRDAVTLAPEELKRRDALIESVRKQAEEIARSVKDSVMGDDAAGTGGGPGGTGDAGEGPATPPPETMPPETSAPWPPPPGAAATPPPPPPPLFTPPVSPPVGTFPRSPTPFPLQPGRLGGPGRVTPPFSSLDSNRANVTQTLTEEDLLPAKKGAPPPLPPPLPGVAPPPPPPGSKKG